jgi:thiol-disulfide isomerase/thioredoxin
MKKLVLGLILVAVAGWYAWGWLRPPPAKLKAALDEARQENKIVLLDFTGSDWCGWCQKLEAESLGKPEFINYSAKYLVTIIVDFPMHHDIPADVKANNEALKKKFGVEGFPTLIALSPAGKVIWKQVGYIDGGPMGVIAPLNRERNALNLGDPIASDASSIADAAPTKTDEAKSAVSKVLASGAVLIPSLPSDAPKLQGIFYSRSNPSIILGGRQCTEGDTVSGMRVLKIARDRVTVEWNGKTEELTMD